MKFGNGFVVLCFCFRQTSRSAKFLDIVLNCASTRFHPISVDAEKGITWQVIKEHAEVCMSMRWDRYLMVQNR